MLSNTSTHYGEISKIYAIKTDGQFMVTTYDQNK